jgi:transposase-like protein
MTISFARHQFPPEIIRHAVWLYIRFTLSYRDVEDLVAERGLDIPYETVRQWYWSSGRCSPENLSVDALASDVILRLLRVRGLKQLALI